MNAKTVAKALEIGPRTKLRYSLVLGRAMRYARSMGLQGDLNALDSAAVGLSHWMDTGRASGAAYWQIREMSAYQIVVLLCECAEEIKEYATVDRAADYYRERFDRRL